MSEERIYRINFAEIEKDFAFKESSLTHKSNNRLKLFPYSSADKNKKVSNEIWMYVEFDGIASSVSRMICDKKLTGKFNADEFVEKVYEQIGYFEGDNSREHFKEIINSMFLKEDKLVDFDIQTMNYVSSVGVQEKIAEFIYSIFIDEEIKEIVKSNYKQEVTNILYKLVLKALPNLEDKKVDDIGYRCYLPFVKELFIKDFKFLISNHELYKNSFKRFLEFYYLFYISQLSFKLSEFEKADLNSPTKLYFSLGWESLSKNRTAYSGGYDNLKNYTSSLFSHAILLELLNHSNIEEQLGYKELFDLFKGDDTGVINEDIKNLSDEYLKRRREGINWDKFKVKEYNSGSSAFDKVYNLFNIIEFQFDNTGRSKQRRLYKECFEKFLEGNFGKKRGTLGYCLTLNEEDIILLTKLCINSQEKIKLNDLFKEFELRGVSFDRDSRIRIVQLYEKLNLIEKKSDSGDAQYVKAIL